MKIAKCLIAIILFVSTASAQDVNQIYGNTIWQQTAYAHVISQYSRSASDILKQVCGVTDAYSENYKYVKLRPYNNEASLTTEDGAVVVDNKMVRSGKSMWSANNSDSTTRFAVNVPPETVALFLDVQYFDKEKLSISAIGTSQGALLGSNSNDEKIFDMFAGQKLVVCLGTPVTLVSFYVYDPDVNLQTRMRVTVRGAAKKSVMAPEPNFYK